MELGTSSRATAITSSRLAPEELVERPLSERLKQARRYAEIRRRLNQSGLSAAVEPDRPAPAAPVPVFDPYAEYGPKIYAKRIRIGHVINVVADYYGMTPRDILSERRLASVVYPRQIAMYLAKIVTPNSISAIARRFGRDHTTAMHATAKIERLVGRDPEFDEHIQALIGEIEAESLAPSVKKDPPPPPPRMTSAPTEWTREKVELLLRRHKEGASFKVIAFEFGMSRGAISGKLNRVKHKLAKLSA